MSNNIDQRVINVMSAVLNITPEQITPDATQDTYEGWDSMKQLDMVVALEEEFDIFIPEEEIATLLSQSLISVVVNECIDAK